MLPVIKPRDRDGNAELKEPEYGTRRRATGFFGVDFMCGYLESDFLGLLALLIVIFPLHMCLKMFATKRSGMMPKKASFDLYPSVGKISMIYSIIKYLCIF